MNALDYEAAEALILKRIVPSGSGAHFESMVPVNVSHRMSVGFSVTVGGARHLELRIPARHEKSLKLALALTKDINPADRTIICMERLQVPTRAEVAGSSAALVTAFRPLVIGGSICNFNGMAGTIGGFVRLADGRIGALSNNHVLALVGKGRIGDSVHQPGRPDAVVRLSSQVGELADAVQLAPVADNSVDCAVAALVAPHHTVANTISPQVSAQFGGRVLGVLDDPDAVDLSNQRVIKIGRTTGITRGKISVANKKKVSVKFGRAGMRMFSGVFEVKWDDVNQPFSLPGDSGSLVLLEDDLTAIGLHFAGGIGADSATGTAAGFSYGCYLGGPNGILRALNVSWI